jgi:gamma-polyglutamate synthase
MSVLFLLLAFVLGWWTFEAIRLRRALRAIPVRIHVNGSRGKSSVTRLLAAALREGGMRTVAKTTGSRARYIHPDGSEDPIVRLSTPNIGEQIGIMDRARREGAEALVIECMAVRPDLQRIAERSIVHATIGVITNVRPDHLDVMGPAVADVEVALSGTAPRDGVLVTGETVFVTYMRAAAEKRGSTFEIAHPGVLPPGAMDGFRYIEHAENVATTLAVTRRLQIPDQVALHGMYGVRPDPGACTRTEFVCAGRTLEFFNIFAANDLDSTVSIWKRVGLGRGGPRPSVALLNLRSDRMDRSLQYAEAVEGSLLADWYVLVGGLTPRVISRFRRRIPGDRLLVMDHAAPPEIFERLAGIGGAAPRIGGVGNIGGIGHDILRFVTGAGGAAC